MFTKINLLLLSTCFLIFFACNCDDNEGENEGSILCSPPQVGYEIFIYQDFEVPSPTLWPPAGWMPDGFGIQIDEAHANNTQSGPECIEVIAILPEFTQGWAGIYWLANGAWKGPGINLLDEFCLTDSSSVSLKFGVRGATGTEQVSFFVGGVTDGNDSINPQVNSGWLYLSTSWEEVEIDLANHDLHNVVGAFGWVTEKIKNPGADKIRFYLDNIRLEVTN